MDVFLLRPGNPHQRSTFIRTIVGAAFARDPTKQSRSNRGVKPLLQLHTKVVFLGKGRARSPSEPL